MMKKECSRPSFPDNPFVFISYRRSNDAIIKSVQELQQKIETNKLPVITDESLEKTSCPHEGWTLWMQQAIEKASALVIVWSTSYRDAWDNKTPPGTANGVSWESRHIRTRIYSHREYGRLINIVLSEDDRKFIPDFLQVDYTVYTYPGEYEKIYRHIAYCLDPSCDNGDHYSNAAATGSALSQESTACIDFRAFIHNKTCDFVGRSFLFDRIDEFITEEESGYFHIEGHPGTGKSSIIAEFVKRTSSLHYFNSRADGYTSPLHFLRHISSQLIKRFSLPYKKLPERLNTDHHIFGNILNDAARSLGKNQKLLIAVDALDEADETSISGGANVLYLPSAPPPHIFFLISSRPRKFCHLPLRTVSPPRLLRLEDFCEENRQDIELYIGSQIEKMKLKEEISAARLTEDEFIRILADRSENNFMYIFYVLRAISRKHYDIHEPDNLPRGLYGYYEDHWRLMKERQKGFTRILYYLCELRRPVSMKELSEYTKESLDIIDQALTDWDQFLLTQKQNGSVYYSLYHSSFRDFLHREKMLQESSMSIREVNNDIASRTLNFLGIRRRTQ